MKKHFIIIAHPYGSEIQVLVKPTKEYAINFLKKKKFSQLILDEMEEDTFEGYATMYADNEGKRAFYALVLHNWKNQNDFLETLVHETNHLVYYIGRRHGFLEEIEAMAYLQEYLFREIRKAINA